MSFSEDVFEDSVSYVDTTKNFNPNFKSFTAVKSELLSYFDSRTILWMNLQRESTNEELFPMKSITETNFNPIVETSSIKIPYMKNCTVPPIEVNPIQSDIASIKSKYSKFHRFLNRIHRRQFSTLLKKAKTSRTLAYNRRSLSLRRSRTWRNIKSSLYPIWATDVNINKTCTQATPPHSKSSQIEYSLFSPPPQEPQPPQQQPIDSLVEGQLLLPSAQFTTSAVSRINFDLASFFNESSRPYQEYSESQITRPGSSASTI
ncbi:hypothetical protein JA1_003343 [Spathaspora sp. JA1]|nr:hypothetical protein JA1_003343 [Spathaspora sp. JA1]